MLSRHLLRNLKNKFYFRIDAFNTLKLEKSNFFCIKLTNYFYFWRFFLFFPTLLPKKFPNLTPFTFKYINDLLLGIFLFVLSFSSLLQFQIAVMSFLSDKWQVGTGEQVWLFFFYSLPQFGIAVMTFYLFFIFLFLTQYMFFKIKCK